MGKKSDYKRLHDHCCLELKQTTLKRILNDFTYDHRQFLHGLANRECIDLMVVHESTFRGVPFTSNHLRLGSYISRTFLSQ